MPRILIKQPNGLYCYFSTVVDAIVVYNMTPEEVGQEIMRCAIIDTQWHIDNQLPRDLKFADEWAEKDTKGLPVYNWEVKINGRACEA